MLDLREITHKFLCNKQLDWAIGDDEHNLYEAMC